MPTKNVHPQLNPEKLVVPVLDQRPCSMKEGAMFEGWLRCVVFKGMFKDELAVEINEKAGGPVSFFVPMHAVRYDANKLAAVRVRVIRQGETAWAIFPSEDSTAVPVNDSDLVSA